MTDRIPQSDQSLEEIFSAVPVVVAILDESRKVVFGKEKLMKVVGLSAGPEPAGSRPGDLMGCVNALTAGGCGESESCALCGAYCAITESRETGQPVTRECLVQTMTDTTNLDVTVTASPYPSTEGEYTLLTVQDASAEKRRQALERVFFHDIMNTASGVSGIARILRDTENPSEYKAMLQVLERSARVLVEEIVGQRELVSAESGDLTVEVEDIWSDSVVATVATTLRYQECAKGKEIKISPLVLHIGLRSDRVLLQRCLANLTKNALEAIEPGETVTLDVQNDSRGVVFSVHNPGFIPRDVQLQIFHRSFSTKGSGRGLGTYGVRLIAESYLKGSVSFDSNPTAGTTFRISLPRSLEL